MSVGATLLALVVLPTIGLGFSTAQIAADRSAAADLADRIGADADRVVTLVQLRFAVTDELIPTAALAYAPAFGIDGASISEIIGFDLAARQRNARREVDDRAARIQGAPEIRAAIAAIGLLRDDVDRGAAEPAAVLATYGAAEAAANREVADSVARLRLEIARLPRGDAAQPSLELLAEAVVALRAVLAQMEALGQSMLSPLSRSEAPIVLAKALGSYEQATERLDALLSGPARSLWREIRNDPATRTFEGAVAAYLRSTLEGAPATVGPAPQVAPVFRAGIERAEHHLEMVSLLGDELRDQATVLRDDAHASFQRAVLGAGGITLLTMAITLWVVQTLRRPLGALEERAQAATQGALDVPPVEERGPRELAVVTRAFNEMVANLRAFEMQANALAAGDLDDPALETPLPGQLGVALQESVARLSHSIVEGQELRERLSREATHDALTGLPNRVAAVSALETALARSRRTGTAVGALFVDLDGFKQVNDAHGHALGDEVLQTTASRLRTAVRDGDVVARLGGDEFVVIAEPVNGFDEASVLGARLVQTLEQPFRLAETTVSISASVGVALNLDPEIDALGMLRDADVAVYEAKARGKGRVEAFDASLSDRLLEQASLDQDLRQAIAIDEFVVHYQPIMALDTGRPTALEALVRWERPGQGITLPSVFLPVAEASGLIVELDQLVLTKVLAQLSSWAEHPVLADVAVALNVSGRGLASTTLLERVDRGLASFGVRPDRLIIEVTESHLLGDLPRGTAQLEGLRQRGVRVALDDFGMGYASITHLRQLPVDMVKIDRSLVADLGDERGRPLTELVVQAAGAMGLDVVAKGVETSGQLDTIRDLRCDFAQGFLFSEPRPAADIEAWMTANLDDTAP